MGQLMIEYRTDLDSVTVEDLDGFFVGWPTHPDAATHLRMLENADAVALAVDAELEAVYEPLGFRALTGMAKRNYESQIGAGAT